MFLFYDPLTAVKLYSQYLSTWQINFLKGKCIYTSCLANPLHDFSLAKKARDVSFLLGPPAYWKSGHLILLSRLQAYLLVLNQISRSLTRLSDFKVGYQVNVGTSANAPTARTYAL